MGKRGKPAVKAKAKASSRQPKSKAKAKPKAGGKAKAKAKAKAVAPKSKPAGSTCDPPVAQGHESETDEELSVGDEPPEVSPPAAELSSPASDGSGEDLGDDPNGPDGHEPGTESPPPSKRSRTAADDDGELPEDDTPPLDEESDDVGESGIPKVDVLTPEPSTDEPYTVSGSFETNGFQQLTAFVEQGLMRLSDAARSDMIEYFQSICHGVHTIGTACSGTDAPVLVVRAFAKALKKVCGVSLKVQHCFSCEKHQEKRVFLKRLFTNMRDPAEDVKFLGCSI